MNQWFQSIPKNYSNQITWDCGKEFLNWKSLLQPSRDVGYYFADPGTPHQRSFKRVILMGFFEKMVLPKKWISTKLIRLSYRSVATQTEYNSRKVIKNYQTPLEVFMSYMDERYFCISLI